MGGEHFPKHCHPIQGNFSSLQVQSRGNFKKRELKDWGREEETSKIEENIKIGNKKESANQNFW